MRRAWLTMAALVGIAAALPAGASAQEQGPSALSEEALGEARGGLATPLGVDIGFGASVRTYVDGSLALETHLSWTDEGVRSEQVFASEAAQRLTPNQAARGAGRQVSVAPGTSVVHDLTENRIASVVLNTANDRTIRQDTDVSLHLPQLPDIQQRIAAERLTQALQALSPQASGLGK